MTDDGYTKIRDGVVDRFICEWAKLDPETGVVWCSMLDEECRPEFRFCGDVAFKSMRLLTAWLRHEFTDWEILERQPVLFR